MAKRKSPDKALDREKKWSKIFNALVELSQNQQKDRQFLERNVKILSEVVYRMKMEQKVEFLKAELILGLKEREALVYKHRYENSENDLADFIECFDSLSQTRPHDVPNDVSNKGEGSQNKALQDEVLKLKSEIDKYKLEKNSEISALLQEKNFVWNQLKRIENDLTEQLKKKCDEIKHANEKVQIFVNRAEELQMSNERLRTKFTKLESESVLKSEEICKLLKEIELLKSRAGSASPLLRPCGAEVTASSNGAKNITSHGSTKIVNKESVSSKTIEKGASSSKKKDVFVIPDTPKLFTSSFKVPKLKSSSFPQI